MEGAGRGAGTAVGHGRIEDLFLCEGGGARRALGAGLPGACGLKTSLFGSLSSKSTSELVHSAEVVPDILGGCPSTKYYQFLPYYFACYT